MIEKSSWLLRANGIAFEYGSDGFGLKNDRDIVMADVVQNGYLCLLIC